MTTRWKQKASVIFTVVVILGICLGLIILILSNGILATNSRNKISITEKRLPGDLSTTESQKPTNVDHRHKDLDNKTNTIHKTSSDEYSREEFIRPLKVHQLPLHTDDLLYESKKNNSKSDSYAQGHRITGNFRNRSSRIWDPHPEYSIDAFGRHLHLILYQDAAFMPDELKVTHVWLNRTEQYEEDHQDHEELHGCFYKGRVRGDEKSVVSVSLCNGMRGHIRTTDGSFFIEPVKNNTNEEDSNILHKIRRESNKHKVHTADKSKDMNCPIEEHLKGDSGTDDNGIDMDISISEEKHERRKRNIYNEHQYTMEVLIAVDRKMQEFHGNEIKSYILTLMQIVSNIYSDASIGNSINVAVINIMLLKDDLSIEYIDQGVLAAHLLKRFCSFMQRRPEHYDTAILLTREQICRNTTETKCDTLGLAELGTICKPQSCSIVQDNGLPAAFTIAHELGHILNMPHDDDKKCDKFRKDGQLMLNIMSSTMGDDIHPWSWSNCSKHYVTEFLEEDQIGCMADRPQHSIQYRNKKQPGEIYSLDQQCELIHGSNSKYCHIYFDQDKECGRLWCLENENTYDCRSSNLPWADGTPCRDQKHWCQKGSCILRDIRLSPVSGGWGPWSPYTQCSRTCGGGVQESQRECNNPTPENGGKYCLGNRKKYRSCSTQECSPDDLDFRELQCKEMNGNHFNITGIDESVKWVPKYGVSPRDECKLFCRIEKETNYFQLANKVRDGTPCSFDRYNKCVNGICRAAGCDNELNSAAQLDRCGVCQGNNDTCDEVTGNIYKSDINSMRETTQKPFHFNIVTIPKGSANIEIIQLESPLTNYIVLLDDKGDYLLNGNNTINTFSRSFPYAGVTFQYSGANSSVERVNTTYSRKLKRDLQVQILSFPTENGNKNDEILLTYTYTTAKSLPPHHRNRHHHEMSYPKPEIYQWKLPEWSPCDSLCQGSQHRSPVCVKVDESLQVAATYCDGSNKPSAQLYRSCNLDCELIRNVTTMSVCSSTCGMIGRRAIKYNCIKRNLRNNTSVFVDNTFCQRSASNVDYEDCTGPCTIWSYSEWSQCTRSCGNGQQTRSVICLSFPGGPEVDESQCSHLSMPKSERIQLCNTEACPAWFQGEQTPCSVTCGIGQRTTAIYCKQNNQIVDKHMCAGYPMLKPIKTNCTMPPCQEQSVYKHPSRPFIVRRQYNTTEMSNRIDYSSGYNSWRTGDWGDCNDRCFKNRTVFCHDMNRYHCPDDRKPREIEKCCIFKYAASWTPCSVVCGNGIRRREFHCHRVYKSSNGGRPVREKVDDSYCQALKIRKRTPKRPQKPCNKTCKWEAGKWTACPEKCSLEFSTRAVTCKARKGRTIPSEYCDINDKPQERQKCQCRREIKYTRCSCLGYRRVSTPCSIHSNSCRGGYESKREKCNPPPECSASCLHVKQVLKTHFDREYVIYIKRKPVHIYCHNMNTTSPAEYLTLREGEQENFSLYYNKRAKDTTSCPTNSRDNEFLDESIRYGRTQFAKIRIDIQTLRVIEDDYTFATSHGKPQPFGSAGDCYNTNQKCPQGYFSINLKNTGFRIRQRTKWETYGDHSSIIFWQKLSFPYTAVAAHCGGYCGSCFISKETHLILETT